MGALVVGLHESTGPETWRWARIEVGTGHVLAGWSGVLVAVVWDRSPP
ncbi:hypothetical protein QN239_31970 [Mycolicibacterium sp. Y3]